MRCTGQLSGSVDVGAVPDERTARGDDGVVGVDVDVSRARFDDGGEADEDAPGIGRVFVVSNSGEGESEGDAVVSAGEIGVVGPSRSRKSRCTRTRFSAG